MLNSKVAMRHEDEVLRISRYFEAPPALLFRLWVDPVHRVRWWGPTGMALSKCEVDFRVGGKWSVTMTATTYDHPVHGVFTEIVEPTRLCFTYVNDYDGHEMLVEMDFVAEGQGTRMDFVQAAFVTVAERDGHNFGWNSTLSMLATYAPKVAEAGGKPVGEPRKPGDI
jgi:uncharacterized protein YndB with AHSA1/START domain